MSQVWRLERCCRVAVLGLLCCSAAAGGAAGEVDPGRGQTPLAIPTFHCLGLYWSPAGGAADKEVAVRFRRQGSTPWSPGLAMRYNPIPDTEEDLADYRGSIVHLDPGTTYEIELHLAGTSTTAQLTATTWNEDFPVGETVRIAGGDAPLAITESGQPQAWRVYDGRGATIDVGHRHDSCLTIDASCVIVRGLTLQGAGAADNTRKSASGAIRIEGGHDIVIEDCDVSDWGRLNPATGFGFNMDSALLSHSAALQRLIVQRCRLHHPACDGSTWYEPVYPTHTMGPQCISLFNTAGNHVIRYNECYSDLEHMYNDVIGGGSNGSFRGSPGHDSDIYGNLVSHCWDDGLEVEGGNRNVRVWDFVQELPSDSRSAPTQENRSCQTSRAASFLAGPPLGPPPGCGGSAVLPRGRQKRWSRPRRMRTSWAGAWAFRRTRTAA